MLIAGGKGFAIQLFDIVKQLGLNNNIFFYDDTSKRKKLIFEKYTVLNNLKDVSLLFKEDNSFCLGTGNPQVRKFFYDKFTAFGGECTSIISPFAHLGSEKVNIGNGSTILTNVIIESTVSIGKGTLLNLSTTITHNCIIGDFCEFSPGVHISGNCIIGNNCSFGTGAVVLPKLKIGNNVIVGAGSVVTKDLSDNATVVGAPAKELARK